MDLDARGGRTGGAPVASASDFNMQKRDRIRQMVEDIRGVKDDPYLVRNHLGGFDCRLCQVSVNNEAAYMTHTQGKKHEANLAQRAAKEAQDSGMVPLLSAATVAPQIRRFIPKIGNPGYQVTKIRQAGTPPQLGLLFQIKYPQITPGMRPFHRFMGAYEQRVEPADRYYQYLLFAAEPYNTIAFKVQSKPIDHESLLEYYDRDTTTYTVQLLFQSDTFDR